jgi:hypothetical protein
MAEEWWHARYVFDSLDGKVKMIGKEWTIQDINNVSLCFTRV